MRGHNKSTLSALHLMSQLMQMKEGQTLGIMGTKEMRVFKLVEIRDYKKKLKGQPEFLIRDLDAEIADPNR